MTHLCIQEQFQPIVVLKTSVLLMLKCYLWQPLHCPWVGTRCEILLCVSQGCGWIQGGQGGMCDKPLISFALYAHYLSEKWARIKFYSLSILLLNSLEWTLSQFSLDQCPICCCQSLQRVLTNLSPFFLSFPRSCQFTSKIWKYPFHICLYWLIAS